MQTYSEIHLGQGISFTLTFDEVVKMLFLWRKRREDEQQRRIERLLNAQEAFFELYEPDRPTTFQDEIVKVKTSIEQGLKDDRR